jgi:lysophospholipase L1-like esterase
MFVGGMLCAQQSKTETPAGSAANHKLNKDVDEIAFEGQGDASGQPTTHIPTTPRDATPAADSSALPLPKEISAADANIRYVGRWDMTKPSAPRASWTYSLVTAKFQGTAINARLKGGGYYQIVVDGQPTRVIGPKDGRDLYELAKGLPDGEHVVEIVRRNEGNWIAPIAFMGFQLAEQGKLLPLPPRSERRILIIGDSISCGYGNEATRDEGNPLDKENGYMTYGGIAARKLNAELQIVAWSGRKLYPNNTMVELYDRALAMEDKPKADLKGWVPGVVLINLGTNDFGNRNSLPDKQGWIGAYKGFIKTIRRTAPGAYIFVASGPMGTAAEWDAWAKAVVADLNQAGDDKVAYLPFPTQDINRDGIGGHWHPNLKTHAKMADRLVKEIGKAVDWK